jgi:heme/copper-type cytochrome/quinol oxidase subunit 2
MLAATFILLQESNFLGWLIDNHDADGWEETAQSWFFAAIVIAVICAGIVIFYKWLKKHSAENIDKKIWSRGHTVVVMIVGLFPVLLMMAAVWYSTRDYFDVVGVGGLVKGIVLGWLLYLLLMLIGHLASPWRRELF